LILEPILSRTTMAQYDCRSLLSLIAKFADERQAIDSCELYPHLVAGLGF
jgi:hypothetical protein